MFAMILSLVFSLGLYAPHQQHGHDRAPPQQDGSGSIRNKGTT
jgi:hypothetical protein